VQRIISRTTASGFDFYIKQYSGTRGSYDRLGSRQTNFQASQSYQKTDMVLKPVIQSPPVQMFFHTDRACNPSRTEKCHLASLTKIVKIETGNVKANGKT